MYIYVFFNDLDNGKFFYRYQTDAPIVPFITFTPKYIILVADLGSNRIGCIENRKHIRSGKYQMN